MVDLFNTGVRPVVDQWLLDEATKKRNYGLYWSASSAGYCQRRLIFERLGVPKIVSDDDARRQRVFTSGHLFHAWIQSITKAAGISIAQEIELQDEELMIRGHFDDLVLLPTVTPYTGEPLKGESLLPSLTQKLILYDYKTRNSRNFGFAKNPSYFHKMQLGTYMYMIRHWPAGRKVLGWENGTNDSLWETKGLTEARTLNIEKDTLRMAEVQYMWSDELEKEIVGYWTSLNAAWKSKKLPPCTCADHENGFMALEKWNGYFYEGEPCSIKWYEKFKESQHASSE